MSISSWPASPKGSLKITGTEPELPPHIEEFQYNLRQFARNEMRPIGQQLDRMTPEQVIAEDSPLWTFREKYLELGINLETLGSLSPQEFSLMFPIIFEDCFCAFLRRA